MLINRVGHKIAEKLLVQEPNSVVCPVLVAEHWRYNIVYYNNVFYGIPQALGPMDLSIEANRARQGIVTGSSIEKAKRNIDKSRRTGALTSLARSLRSLFDFIATWLMKLFHAVGLS